MNLLSFVQLYLLYIPPPRQASPAACPRPSRTALPCSHCADAAKLASGPDPLLPRLVRLAPHCLPSPGPRRPTPRSIRRVSFAAEVTEIPSVPPTADTES